MTLVSVWACTADSFTAIEPRPEPCLTASPECEERITLGAPIYLPLYSTHALRDGSEDVDRAIIVVHGSDRNGDDYFERMVAAARLEGVENSTLIIAPTFQTIDDGPAADEPYWTSGGWKRGHLSSASGLLPRVSSYAAIEWIFQWVPASFPNVTEIVLVGHSAGGQVVHRYAGTNRVQHPNFSQANFRYIVANPSTYLYLGPERDSPAGFVTPVGGACPDYDEWHYGLVDLNTHASAVTADTIRTQLLRRDVRILIGDADTLSGALDVSCGANLQGRHRFERGRTLIRAMDALYPGHGHSEWIVPGVGHSSSSMFQSPVGRSAIFGN